MIVLSVSQDGRSLCCCLTPYMTKRSTLHFKKTPAALLSDCLFFLQLAFVLTSLLFIQIGRLRYFNHITCAWIHMCEYGCEKPSSESIVPWDSNPTSLLTDQTPELWCIQDLSWYSNSNRKNADDLYCYLLTALSPLRQITIISSLLHKWNVIPPFEMWILNCNKIFFFALRYRHFCIFCDKQF